MRFKIDDERRHAFRDWLRSEFKRHDYYVRRGDHYLISEFWRDHLYDAEGAPVELELASLGRYLREDNPVVPTPETCRELARALGRHPIEVLLQAGYLIASDLEDVPDGVWKQAQLLAKAG